MAKPIEIAVILTAQDRMSAAISRAVNVNKKRIDNLNNLSNKSIIAGAAIADGLGLAINAAEESEVATNRLKQVFKQMGDGTGKAATQASEYASKLQMQVGYEDEVIMATQAKLATFKALSNETGRMSGMFDRATAAAFDMQSAGFGDAAGNAVQLGKAMQDPIKGIMALRKSGITFTDAEKKKIEMLVKSGQITKAQGLVMKAIEKQVGGVAAATATGATKVKIALGEVSESIGRALLPTVKSLADFMLNRVIPVIQQFVDKHPRLTKYVAAAAIALIGFGVALRVVSFTLTSYNLILGLVSKSTLFKRMVTFLAEGGLRRYAITFIGTVIPAITSAITASYNFAASLIKGVVQSLVTASLSAIKFAVTLASTLWSSLVSATAAIWSFTAALLANPITWIVVAIVALAVSVYLIIKHWDKVKAFFSKVWQFVKDIFWKAVDWLKNIFLKFTPYGLIFKHWDKISAFFSSLWGSIKAIFFKAVNWFIGLHIAFYNAGKNIVTSIWTGIKAMANKPVEAIKAIVKKVRDFLPFSPAKEGPLKDIHKIKLIETISSSIKAGPLLNAMNGVMKQVNGFVGNSSINTNRPSFSKNADNSPVSISFAPVIHLNGGATKEDGDMLSSKLKEQFKKMMRDYESNNRRVAY